MADDRVLTDVEMDRLEREFISEYKTRVLKANIIGIFVYVVIMSVFTYLFVSALNG